jgi:hypothetical protein
LVLLYIGEATAIGQVIDIPILIRSLADGLMYRDEKDLPLPYDSSLLSALDAGIDADSPCALVGEYYSPWWTLKIAPEDDLALTTHNIPKALQKHFRQTLRMVVPQIVTFPQCTRRSTCNSCDDYKNIASELLKELQGIWEFSRANETASMTQWQLDIRRAAGLHHAHEAVILKELHSGTGKAKASGRKTASGTVTASGNATESGNATGSGSIPVNRRSQHMSKIAAAEFERLSQLPPSSYKWTWGPELTVEDVKNLAQNPATLHSGDYDSLKTGGVYRGEFSSDDSLPSRRDYTGAGDSSVASDVFRVPMLSTSRPSIDKLKYAHETHPVMFAHNANVRNNVVYRKDVINTNDDDADADAAEVAWGQSDSDADADAAEKAWGDDAAISPTPEKGTNSDADADDAEKAWGDDSHSDVDADAAEMAWMADSRQIPNDLNSDADADAAELAWGDPTEGNTSDADAAELARGDDSHSDADADAAERAWNIDSSQSAVGSSDGNISDTEASHMHVPESEDYLLSPRIYTSGDFNFVNDSWVADITMDGVDGEALDSDPEYM